MMFYNKTIEEWVSEFPILVPMRALEEVFWVNPHREPSQKAIAECSIGMPEILDASSRLERFASYIRVAFPETEATSGILESPLTAIPNMQKMICAKNNLPMQGKWLLKCDSHLPISGSIKARGGIYEVLQYAEKIAIREGGLKLTDDYAVLAGERYRRLFSRYSIAVGSTGNLGLSIGIISSKLGFHVTVHMSADARQWKKDMLRSKGVEVVEYEQDYSKAVEEGRRQASTDAHCHFVDDENSQTLFLGYAVAVLRLKKQLVDQGIPVDKAHPLFVYLPCGVGGGPGGVAFGIKQVFGDWAHCFFAEPTHSPCMLLGMATDYHNRVCVQDFGIDNKTIADGLAVGRVSGFVGKLMKPFISGCYTVDDAHLYQMLAQLVDTEQIRLEPSALAGMAGPIRLASLEAKAYLSSDKEEDCVGKATHIIWATGGNMVPSEDMAKYYKEGEKLL